MEQEKGYSVSMLQQINSGEFYEIHDISKKLYDSVDHYRKVHNKYREIIEVTYFNGELKVDSPTT
jgi:hypothetical protein